MVSVYPDRAGIRWWTKCWFNNKEDGEPAIEIDQKLAILFLHDQIDKDEWLEEYYPKQMEMYHNAIEQTKEQLLSQSQKMSCYAIWEQNISFFSAQSRYMHETIELQIPL